MFNARGVDTVVGRGSSKITIEDFVVLKEGVHYGPHSGWGWKHIWEEELRTGRFHTYYLKRYGLDLKGEALKQRMLEDIKEALEKGEIYNVLTDNNGGIIEYKIRYGDIFVSVNGDGSITTAYPRKRW